MRIQTSLTLLMASAMLVTQQPAPAQPPPPPPAVKVGDLAPDFTLPYIAPGPEPGKFENKQAKLSDFKGKQNVVLAFFPAAFSPG